MTWISRNTSPEQAKSGSAGFSEQGVPPSPARREASPSLASEVADQADGGRRTISRRNRGHPRRGDAGRPGLAGCRPPGRRLGPFPELASEQLEANLTVLKRRFVPRGPGRRPSGRWPPVAPPGPPLLGLLQRSDVGGDSSDRIRHPGRVEQGKLQRDEVWHPSPKGITCSNCMPLHVLEDASSLPRIARRLPSETRRGQVRPATFPSATPRISLSFLFITSYVQLSIFHKD